jgi:phosphate ABC transporter phosphate-binding protein
MALVYTISSSFANIFRTPACYKTILALEHGGSGLAAMTCRGSTHMGRRLRAAVLGMVVLALVCLGCTTNGGGTKSGGSASTVTGAKSLQGGGSTFIAPLMEKWAGVYGKANGVKVDYTRAGSGKGISQMTAGTYDFGCTDAPMNEEQTKEATAAGGAVTHIPLVIGSVVPAYNLKGIDKPLKFTGPVLADIFLGKIKKWNEPALKELNSDIALPDQNIVVVHRSDPSGTTFLWTNYLAKVSPEWKEKGLTGLEVQWPVGDGQKGTDGVAGQIKSTAGAIGYIEVAFALKNKDTIHIGSVRNRKGKDIVGSDLPAVSAAAEGVEIPDSLTFLLIDADGENAYPICGVTWAVFFTEEKDAAKGKALVDFLRWCVHEGQAETAKLDYAALPPKLVQMIDKKLDTIKIGQ